MAAHPCAGPTIEKLKHPIAWQASTTDDLLAVLDSVGADRVHYVGVSMGALAGLAAASRAPERFTSVVVCNSRLRPSAEASADLAKRGQCAIENGMQALVDVTLQKWFGRARLPLPDSTLRNVAAMIASTRAAGFAAYACSLRSYDLKSLATTLLIPILLIAGSDDGTVALRVRRNRRHSRPSAICGRTCQQLRQQKLLATRQAACGSIDMN